MAAIIAVNPFRCRMWHLHDRIESHINDETCRSEIESIDKHGQLVPVLGRTLRGDPVYEFELIYGARRLFIARHINKPLLIEVREMSDREAIVAMDVENRLRQDVSPYERGKSYARYLQSGAFKSQEEIARALRISASQVCRLLKLAQLPAAVVSAFGNPVDICEGWGLNIMEALEDPHKRQLTLNRARLIGKQKMARSARDVYQELMSAATHGRKVKRAIHDEVVKDERGLPLFRVRQLAGSVAFLVPTGIVNTTSLERLRQALSDVLRQDNSPDRRIDRTSLSIEVAMDEPGRQTATRPDLVATQGAA